MDPFKSGGREHAMEEKLSSVGLHPYPLTRTMLSADAKFVPVIVSVPDPSVTEGVTALTLGTK
jgi:hypothetical protein